MRDTVRALGLWLTTAFRASPLLTALLCVSVVAQQASGAAQALAVAWIVDGVSGARPGGVVHGTVILVATFVVLLAMLTVSGVLEETVNDRVHHRLHTDLLSLTTAIPGIAHHERADVANRLTRLRENATMMGSSAASLMVVVATVVNAGSVLVLLATVHPFLLLLPVLALGRVWAAAVSAHVLEDARMRTAPHASLVHRLLEICGSPRHGMEIRVFGLRSVLLDRVARLRRHLYAVQAPAARRGAAVEVAVRILFGLAYGGAILFLIQRARSGSASAGDVTLVILLAPQVDGAATGIARSVRRMAHAVSLFGAYVWLRDYAKANSFAASTSQAPDRLRDGITLCGVGFTYPGAEYSALSDIDLRIPAGSTVALVGENGAGKTTLVKLLARLYDPTHGSILVDGQGLRFMDPAEWRSHISAGFQDFCSYRFTAREEVGLGDLSRLEDDKAIQAALHRADATTVIAQMPNGLDTQLGTNFAGGVELSGGQSQRLALARTFMRDEPLLLLLDEPTAALDPESEDALLERFADASKDAARRTGGITVLVSHRFSTARMADLVVVIAEGRVVEMGAHHELVRRPGGWYAELYALQARQYR